MPEPVLDELSESALSRNGVKPGNQSGSRSIDEISDDDIHEIPSATPDLRTELAHQIQELAPEVIADGKVDVTTLCELLGEDVAPEGERFGLFWPGKKRAMRIAQEPTTATLRPDKENSKDWDTTKNVFIEGDNLEVLKILQKHYHGKIKMIYIDPPYNTGKDFVYSDNYRDGLQAYLEWTKQVNGKGQKKSTNAESDGRFHSNWLTMMYPRLKLARNLLSPDGIIFISIDDHEQDNLRKICNEVFGEANFAGQLVWKKGGTGKNDSQFAVVEHEYVLAFCRSIDGSGFGVDTEATVTTSYNRQDDKGRYSLVRLDSKTLGYVSSLDFPIIGPDGREYVPEQPSGKQGVARWRWGREKVSAEADSLVFERGYVYTKNYESEGARPRSLLIEERFGVTRTGKAEAEAAIGQSGVFDFPKPVRLIQHLVRIATDKDAIVMDFFAGSGTTAHAVMAQNAKDGGSRKFILVQLPEPTPENSEANLLGYKNIAQISRRRIVGAGRQLVEAMDRDRLDTGFRAFSLAETNFSKWRATSDIDPGELEQQLLDLSDSTEDHATPDALLIELLLKRGYSLTERVDEVEIAELKLLSVGDGLLLAYLNEHIKPTLAQLRVIVDADPQRIIVLEDAFQGDDQLKTNLFQLVKSRGRGRDTDMQLWTA